MQSHLLLGVANTSQGRQGACITQCGGFSPDTREQILAEAGEFMKFLKHDQNLTRQGDNMFFSGFNPVCGNPQNRLFKINLYPFGKSELAWARENVGEYFQIVMDGRELRQCRAVTARFLWVQ